MRKLTVNGGYLPYLISLQITDCRKKTKGLAAWVFPSTNPSDFLNRWPWQHCNEWWVQINKSCRDIATPLSMLGKSLGCNSVSCLGGHWDVFGDAFQIALFSMLNVPKKITEPIKMWTFFVHNNYRS
jgi:hypothetical protein